MIGFLKKQFSGTEELGSDDETTKQDFKDTYTVNTQQNPNMFGGKLVRSDKSPDFPSPQKPEN